MYKHKYERENKSYMMWEFAAACLAYMGGHEDAVQHFLGVLSGNGLCTPRPQPDLITVHMVRAEGCTSVLLFELGQAVTRLPW